MTGIAILQTSFLTFIILSIVYSLVALSSVPKESNKDPYSDGFLTAKSMEKKMEKYVFHPVFYLLIESIAAMVAIITSIIILELSLQNVLLICFIYLAHSVKVLILNGCTIDLGIKIAEAKSEPIKKGAEVQVIGGLSSGCITSKTIESAAVINLICTTIALAMFCYAELWPFS